MKKHFLRIIALVLSCLLLVGCSDIDRIIGMLERPEFISYDEMEYTRPNLNTLKNAAAKASELSQGEDVTSLMDAVYGFYDEYDAFYTNYSLADLHYCADLTDLYWEDEYNYCLENSAAVDAMLEELYYTLAKSPLRSKLELPTYFGPGFFDSYEGENNWDETFTALLEQEAALQSQYYDLSAEAAAYGSDTDSYYDACADEMAQLLVELIELRQQIAACWGYDDYVQFATDFYYYRDYTPAQSESYLADICTELVPLYRKYANSPNWEVETKYASEHETYNYVKSMASQMGGTIQEAFTLMDSAGLYDISYSPNKYNTSFEVYLTSYYEPFIFLCPQETIYDKLTFAHEFGHFCNDYASYGSYAGVDVAEVFSQGMEYLSLCYTSETHNLLWLKMADSLSLFVEQAAFATFEQRMYSLTGSELTPEGLYRLYDEVAQAYGFDAVGYDEREFVTITHFYTNPMYIISYVVSNDAALQLYQMELEESGSGLSCFEENLTTECSYFMEFLEEAGLQSPFEEGRVTQIRETFEAALD